MTSEKLRGVPLILAAQRLGMSPERVRRRIANGELHGWQETNGRWLVNVRSIAAVLRQRKERKIESIDTVFDALQLAKIR